MEYEKEPREIEGDMDRMSRRREGACTTGSDADFLKETAARNRRGSAGMVDGIDEFPMCEKEDY